MAKKKEPQSPGSGMDQAKKEIVQGLVALLQGSELRGLSQAESTAKMREMSEAAFAPHLPPLQTR
jgi:hypothetical protein